MDASALANGDGTEITWLGHATFKIRSPSGKVILTDPFLADNPATPASQKRQDRVDLILPSHAHADNFADTVDIAGETGATVFCIFEIAQFLQRKGLNNVVGMNIGGTVPFDGIDVTMVKAWHSTSIADGDTILPGGTAVGFVIKLESGFTIYFSGDTAVFLDMQLIRKLLKPELAILCIGDHFTMGPRSAAEAIRLLGVKRVIPMHYGTFPTLTGTPERLRQETADIKGLEIYVMEPGKPLVF